MRVAVVIPAAGAPGTLATTAFIGALMEGFSANDLPARVYGLTMDATLWHPTALGDCETSAPWLAPISYRLGDRADALSRGIFDHTRCDCSGPIRWRLELLFERALSDVAEDDRAAYLLVDSRSHLLMSMCARVARRLDLKLVAVSNEALADHLIDPSTRDDYVRCVVGCADGVWCFSEHLASYWESNGISRSRIMISPPAVRDASFGHALPAATWDALYIGNLAHKEIDNLLDITERVTSQRPGFRLLVHGDASDDDRARLVTIVAQRGLSDVIAIEPPVPPARVPEILASASVLLLPRASGEFSSAGFPNKLGEYLASGRPVVVTGVGDIPRYLKDGVSAFLVTPDDNAELADTVVRVLESPDCGSAVGREGQAFAQANLRASEVTQRLNSFVESLRPLPRESDHGHELSVLDKARHLLPDKELTRRDLSLTLRRFVPRSR